MRYENMVQGEFLSRLNRFIAHIRIRGTEEVCHVKNTGRCRELLTPGATVWCQEWDNPNRKTKFDLIAVQKGDRCINMDSQAPNVAAKQWLLSGGLGEISELRGEYTHGDSRFDFSFMKEKTYSEFIEKNKVLKDSAYEYIHIIEVYGPMALVESSSDYGSKSFIDRLEVDDIVKMVYNRTLYVKNPTKLKKFIGFKTNILYR